MNDEQGSKNPNEIQTCKFSLIVPRSMFIIPLPATMVQESDTNPVSGAPPALGIRR
jgi:hypothetical protein